MTISQQGEASLSRNSVGTTCPYCGVGCGVIVEQAEDGTRSVRGDPKHPANFGRLCSKGSALMETIDLEGRLLHPMINGQQVGWNEALDHVAQGFSRAIAEHGPDSVAFYVSGQFLTEDYYVANKLMKGFIGSANIDTNSRLCMASSVAGHRRAFGTDTVPGLYEDLECADLVVLTGSNLAWCHPVLYQRLAAAKAARPEMRVVLIDPRRTMTAEIADLYLPIRPDGDTALFAGLLAWLAAAGQVNESYVTRHTSGFAEALAAASALDRDMLDQMTGLEAAEREAFYTLFTTTGKTVTVYSQGVNQSSCGTDKVNAIINCHLATGRIGRPGMGPFSVTGQPNAMGGREVGGLANMLAAHMEIENPEHRALVGLFWNAPRMPEKAGLKAVDLFHAVADGRIKALWIMATNPVDSMPDADAVQKAIAACPFVVVSDVLASTDTMRHAHVALPALAWGEKDGTVTNSERRISRQRAFLPAPAEARADWRILCDVAARMGFAEAFSYSNAAEIFAEHAALSALGNEGRRDFDIGALATIGNADFEALKPVLWPAFKENSFFRTVGQDGRFFADGRFFTEDRKARFIAVTPSLPVQTDAAWPLVLNTGRIRDQWHTMTRTGKSPRLSQHLAEPFVEIHPDDAAPLGIAAADLVSVRTALGRIVVRALLSPRQRKGMLFVPMHWTDQFASCARVDALVPDLIDPVSGQPASKNVAARIEPYAPACYGFAVLQQPPDWEQIGHTPDYWAISRCTGGWRLECAFTEAPADMAGFAASLIRGGYEDGENLSYVDVRTGQARYAAFDGARLTGALYVDQQPVGVARGWAAEQLEADFTDPLRRFIVIAGRPGKGSVDRGAIVCSCFGVGATQIKMAIAGGCHTVDSVGQALQAGTNCGSCRAEIRILIERNEAGTPATVAA
ncbi:Assimilatory nitrate reductase catalytic subunit [Granulibacter bethesdensis]|uniref:nitrate reductase n=1 Tax=Granulibacter bethesdensis TaxID=364410 RepID=UPI00090AA073|nr:nitrate reductase [Granulibacter bethesdensis]APH57564.1 Assimilatory nitrate reductase catalytic subunit [Granulibacter bethesdensis]